MVHSVGHVIGMLRSLPEAAPLLDEFPQGGPAVVGEVDIPAGVARPGDTSDGHVGHAIAGTSRVTGLRRHVLIGRGKLCDVRIGSPSVSRHHAMVVSSPSGVVLIDLESTNGTLVDDKPIKEQALDVSGTIIIGDCSIDFVSEDEHEGLILKLHSAKHAEQYGDNYVTRNLDLNEDELEGAAIKGSINSKGDKIYHVPGTSKYAAIKIDESKGECWFADENAAKASGWRAPRSLG